MKTEPTAKLDGAAVLGVGAAACAACCTGPILGLLAAIGIGTAAGFALFGLAGVIVAAIVGAVLYRRRRNRDPGPPPVATLLRRQLQRRAQSDR